MVGKKKPQKSINEEVIGRVPCCSVPKILDRDLSHISDGHRIRLISIIAKMWVNGTNITYFFFKEPAHWRGGRNQEQAVRDAIGTWKRLGIGLTFQEVDNAANAMIRIGFDQTDGSWSYVGRDCVDVASDPSKRTTNFGWDLTTPYGRDTALHEIGHVIGLSHEHQNEKAGIIWEEEKVYESFGGPPNNWSREDTYWNIIRKIPANTVKGSAWDKNSIMHYQFEAGLILKPSEYQTQPLIPEIGLSPTDIETIKLIYPTQEDHLPELHPFESQKFNIAAGEQANFIINPSISRKYTLQTFGEMDTVMVLFELRDGIPEYIEADDDSGLQANARIVTRLQRDRQYLVRIRLYYMMNQGRGAIMLY